jgi:NADH-quinone oxidoreductase subunit L
LAGLPFLAGFYSKDLILHQALTVHPLLGWMGVLTAGLTALYTFRMVFLAFWGPTEVPPGVHARESGGWMVVALLALSVGALASGFAFEHRLPIFLAGVQACFLGQAGEHAHVSHAAVAVISAVVAVAGVVLAWVMYVRRPGLPDVVSRAWPRLFSVLQHRYYVDEGYEAAVIKPLRATADGCYGIDRFFIDGLVWLVTAVPRVLGFMLRGLQRGAMQGYGLTMMAGFGILLILALSYAHSAAP